MYSHNARGLGNVIVGVLLVGLGALFLLGQFLQIDLLGFLWPFFVIVPGLLFLVGMLLAGRGAGGLAIPGSIVTTVGLVLLYQNLFNHFESWAYAWALVFPTSVGIGLIIDGLWSDQPRTVRHGKAVTKVGLVIFLIFGAFFELIIGISRGRPGGFIWPLALVGLGVYVLLRRGAREPRPVTAVESPTLAGQPVSTPPAVATPPEPPAGSVSGS